MTDNDWAGKWFAENCLVDAYGDYYLKEQDAKELLLLAREEGLADGERRGRAMGMRDAAEILGIQEKNLRTAAETGPILDRGENERAADYFKTTVIEIISAIDPPNTKGEAE